MTAATQKIGRTTWPRGVTFADDLEHNGWDSDNGVPTTSTVATAIQVFTVFNAGRLGRELTVREVGDAFNLDDGQVRSAVEAHPWMYLSGPDDDATKQTIGHDGE